MLMVGAQGFREAYSLQCLLYGGKLPGLASGRAHKNKGLRSLTFIICSSHKHIHNKAT